jgi:hypothetical protein
VQEQEEGEEVEGRQRGRGEAGRLAGRVEGECETGGWGGEDGSRENVGQIRIKFTVGNLVVQIEQLLFGWRELWSIIIISP